MRRADRLFQLVQILRTRRFATGQQLADALQVSKRTVYRDIQDLQASEVPIRGEAGVGYTLERGYELPPLRFTTAELEALVLGARMVQSFADQELSEGARSALVKIEAVLPEQLRSVLIDTPLYALDFRTGEMTGGSVFGELRRAIAAKRTVTFAYRDREGQQTARTVRPLGLYFWGRSWSLAAWCEMRSDYRNFRPDRMDDVVQAHAWSDDTVTLERFLAEMRRRNPYPSV